MRLLSQSYIQCNLKCSEMQLQYFHLQHLLQSKTWQIYPSCIPLTWNFMQRADRQKTKNFFQALFLRTTYQSQCLESKGLLSNEVSIKSVLQVSNIHQKSWSGGSRFMLNVIARQVFLKLMKNIRTNSSSQNVFLLDLGQFLLSISMVHDVHVCQVFA